MKLRIDMSSLPDGYEVSITGLNAVLINRQEVEIDEETELQYEATTGNKLSEVAKDKLFGGSGRTDNVPTQDFVSPFTTTTSTVTNTEDGGEDD